jgi:uncharacterized membrane protein
MIWSILSGLSFLAGTVMFVMVLIKLFQNEGTGKGILGLICGLYTFVWGWMKHKELNITKIMIAWTALYIVGGIFSSLASAAMQ